MRKRARLLGLTLLLGGCRAAVSDAPTLIEFTYVSRQILVPVDEGADHLLFLLDTGASASAVDAATAQRLRLEPGPATRVEGTAGVVETGTCRVPSLSVGGVQVDDLVATVRDLGGVPAPPGRHVDGILGGDFLAGLSIRIDFVAQTLVIARGPAAALPSSPDHAPAVSVPLVLDNGIPRLSATLDGAVPADFRLDTGASLFDTPDVYLNITQGDWDRLRAHDGSLMAQGALSARGEGGELQLPLGRLRALSLGTLEIPAPFVIVQPPVGYFARPEAVGFVSNNLLEKCSPVTIDYAGLRLMLSRPAAAK